MDNTELMIGIGGLILAGLTYFAGIQRKRYLARKESRERRIENVVQKYLALDDRHRRTGIHDLLLSGVLTLANTDEVKTVCARIALHGRPSPLHNLSTKLDRAIPETEYLRFFKWFHETRNETTVDFHNQQNFSRMIAEYNKRDQ